MDDIHTTRHQPRSKRASKGTAAANSSRPTKAEAPSQVHQRNKALQADHPTNSEASSTSNPWSQRFCGQWLGRMSKNKEIHNRICHCAFWNNSQLWEQNAGNNCPLKCRGRAIWHQHRRSRSTSHQKPLDGASQHQQDQHEDPHRLIMWQEHGHKNWIPKKSKAHWTQTSSHSTIDLTRLCETDQNSHKRQPSRHSEKSWTWHPAFQLSLKPQANSFTSSLQQASSNTSTCCSVRAPKHTKFHNP